MYLWSQVACSRNSHVFGISPVEYAPHTETMESEGLKGSATEHVIFLVVTVAGWGGKPKFEEKTHFTVYIFMEYWNSLPELKKSVCGGYFVISCASF